MASAQLGDALRQIHRLFGEGTSTGLADGQLLERFLDHRDESAFATLVERHGPMVLDTCQAVLKDRHDAEDAFQAAFLILVRKAGSIRAGDSLGGWLHRVARRVAIEANAEAARRRTKERKAGAIAAATASPAAAWDDLRPALHTEVDRLPEKYRMPIVLCDLQGLTRDEAASQLRWTEGMVRSRLAKARRLLRSRLTRRGLAPATVLFGGSARGAVPETWVTATTQAASTAATNGLGTTSAATLVAAVLKAMSLTKLKMVAATALTITALAAYGAIAIRDNRDESSVQKNEKNVRSPASVPLAEVPPATPRPDQTGSIVFHGRVLDPDGRPREGARLYLFQKGRETSPRPSPSVRAASDAAGRFRFEVPRAEFNSYFDAEPWSDVSVIAVADGLGLALGHGPTGDEALTLRLVTDDVPIAGRLIDLQGRPVAGASVRVLAVKTPASDDLSPWLDALKTRKSGFDVERDFLPGYWYRPEESPIVAPVVSDSDGRFRITGIGRERLATLVIEGPTIESFVINAMTKGAETIRVPSYRSPGATADVTYVGNRFEHVAGPSRPVEGTVRDKGTGRPLVGVTIQAEEELDGSSNPIDHVRTTTDEQGRYRLTGLPKGREGKVLVLPGSGQPFLRSLETIGGQAGAESAQLDIELTRGVRVTGRITDKRTGRPVKARVEYFVFADNPHLDEAPGFRWSHDLGGSLNDDDGTFRIIALPGSGAIAAQALEDEYLLDLGTDNDGNGILDTHPYNAIPSNFNAITLIAPAPGAESAAVDLVFDRGRNLSGTVLDPDGKPLPGALISGLHEAQYWEHTPLKTDQFTMSSLRPGKPRFLQFIHAEKKLAGWLMVREDETPPPVVRLAPWGVVTGRLVDDDGLPRTDLRLVFSWNHKKDLPHGRLQGNGSGTSGRIVPDGNGRFLIEGLAPGLLYSLEVEGKRAKRIGWAVRDLIIKPGENRDLGDVRAVPSSLEEPE
ncbi:RNA polymerase sigma factor, sigma-70 family [Singulisphaera sp. GP187]|uniref:sigma-70 family RNA polymerase sigma factor n=1 Tax=Singulisphaera sp. GP187 TaxID=1882752 RepID=UPI00092AF54C|nr:sigma-70 family RNA polymerase sigma factor [Singulisphaera sp. GP187]SIO28280.1 RNA polymerase sigma factor, sigma-70 family [Singulisphaera sp. GP187]